MTFNPHTEEDREEMLAAIDIDRGEEFFSAIPAAVRFPDLRLPAALTEMEAADQLAMLAGRNIAFAGPDVFLGAGSYRHFIPATVGQILARGEFYTAYTPYQPEVAQGTLQVIYEFQSLIATLLGVDIANASMYDGATALAEGALITVSLLKGRRRIVITPTVHPAYCDVLRTYVQGLPLEIVGMPRADGEFVATPEQIAPYLGDDLACVVMQYPNFFGAIEQVSAIADLTHSRGGSLVVGTLPMPLALLQPPGQLGADVVAAEGQSLGVPQSFGGPYVGLLGARQSFVRQMPGRLAGITTDSDGKRGFVLTLQTREQHIRREKATSNICTNQGLMATAATTYMATVGPTGFREAAYRSYQNAHYLAENIASVPGYALAIDAPFFNEFVVSTPSPAREVNAELQRRGILGGFDLGRLEPRLDHHLLLCATETNTRAGIERMVESLPPGRRSDAA